MNTARAPKNLSNDDPHRSRRDLRKLILILVLACAPLVIHDTIAPREREITTNAALFAIRGYQRYLSPYLGSQCRFSPTCSAYGQRSIEKHGFVVGAAKTAWRIIRCNPFTEKGTSDPP